MKPSLATSFGWPFLVTIVGVGLTALLGSCDSTISCLVKTFVAAPFMLVVLVSTGFVAGRVSSSPIGLVAVLAATGLVWPHPWRRGSGTSHQILMPRAWTATSPRGCC